MMEQVEGPAIRDRADPVQATRMQAAFTTSQLDEAERADLQQRARDFLERLDSATKGSVELHDLSHALHGLGNREMAALVGKRSRLLPAATDTSAVSLALTELTELINRLDPATRGPLDGQVRLFGLIPLGSRLDAYFNEYQQAQIPLRDIMERLRDSKDELLRETIAIDAESRQLHQHLDQLRRLTYLAELLDQGLTELLPNLERRDPERARLVAEELLYLVRQKRSDLLSQAIVTQQGQQVLALGRGLNLELIKGVDRALNTTLYAFSLAVDAARRLTGQELVLSQLREIDQRATSAAQRHASQAQARSAGLRQQSDKDGDGADLSGLKQAFVAIHQALDQLADHRSQASDALQQSAQALDGELSRATLSLADTAPDETEFARLLSA